MKKSQIAISHLRGAAAARLGAQDWQAQVTAHHLWLDAATVENVAAVLESHDALVAALKLIQHATKPAPNDGGYHEAAYEISTNALQGLDDSQAVDIGSEARSD